MGINKVDQKSIKYRLLWNSIKLWHHVIYYQRVEISNQDRVPDEGAVVFTPNHQNALMDALALLFGVKRTIVFLARADIFRKKTVAEILYFLRILPVFRPRDGQGEVKKNKETFSKTSEVLKKNLGVVIFPEGTHTDKQSLLPLKKGFAKIALQTEEANDFNLGIKLVPIGISYTDYEQCRSTLSINFGDPIDLSPYYEDYKDHPAKAFNAIRDKMSDALKQNMIHIEDDENYECNEYLMTAFTSQVLGKNKQNHRILDGRSFLSKLQTWKEQNIEAFDQLQNQTRAFLELTDDFSKRQRVRMPIWSISKWLLHTVIFILLSPLLLGMTLLQLPNYLISNIPSLKIKDHQFHSTFRFVIGFSIVPIIYIIEQLIFNVIFSNTPWYYFLFIYFISLLLMSFSLNSLRNYRGETRIFLYKTFKAKQYKKVAHLLSDIQKTIQSI